MANLNPSGDHNIIFVNGGPSSAWSSNIVYGNQSITTAGNYHLSASNYVDTSSWSYPVLTESKILNESKLQEIIDNVIEELNHINQKYRIWDAAFTGCDILAAKMIFAQLPKNTGEFGITDPLSALKRRRVFLLVKLYGDATKEYIVDPFAAQHGGIMIQPVTDNSLPEMWTTALRYKSPTSLVKRLAKEGCPSKELFLKDAIALSTRYAVSSISPTQMDARLINPDDTEGRKFLEKFSKEVGFKTTLAQLLLDNDPIVAEKAKVIAQLILQR